MIPIRDSNPTQKFPVVTVSLIAINVLLFFYELLLESSGQLGGFIEQWGVIPVELTNSFGSEAITLFTSMFLHGGWAHLLGNMLYLWIFGDNVEDRLGRGRFLLFYVLTGLLASLAQTAIAPDSTVPTIGASGAISGVLGAYLVEFPRARVLTIVFRFLTEVPAVLVLGFWFVLQFFEGVASLSTINEMSGGVAFFAHLGGFVAGAALMRPFQVGNNRPPTGRRGTANTY